jgi:hypothetical protein
MFTVTNFSTVCSGELLTREYCSYLEVPTVAGLLVALPSYLEGQLESSSRNS